MVTSAMEKSDGGYGRIRELQGEGDAISNWEVRKRLTQKVTFESRSGED